jgi:hypothetical protein
LKGCLSRPPFLLRIGLLLPASVLYVGLQRG